MVCKWLINNIPVRTLTPNQAEDIEQVTVMTGDKVLEDNKISKEMYKQIIAGLPNNYYRDQVFNVLTDKTRHSNFYNYIYTTTTRA